MSQKSKDHRRSYTKRNPIAKFMLEHSDYYHVKPVYKGPKRDKKLKITDLTKYSEDFNSPNEPSYD